MDAVKEDTIKRMAYNFYQIRIRAMLKGDDKKDWFDAQKAYDEYEKLHNGIKEDI